MLRRARWGTFLTYALAGLLCGVWVTRLPALATEFGIAEGRVGVGVLVWGLGALAAMQGLRGVLARAGSRASLRTALPLTAVAFALVALAPGYGTLLVALALFGMAFGVTDVAMNAQGGAVERAYGRPVMNGMHAGWCVGAMTGGLYGSLTAALGLGFTPAMLSVAVTALPVALALRSTYLADPGDAQATTEGRRARLPLAVYLIGALAFIAFMAEGSIADWSGLLLHGELGASEALAALGYPLFETAMLIGRLVGDRLRTALGTRRLLVAAGLGTAVAMTAVVLAPAAPIALAGFFLAGLAICTVVPITMSVAGTIAPGQATAAISQVGMMGYGGLLLGPVVVGFLSEATSLRAGLAVVIGLALIVALGARFVPINRRARISVAAAEPAAAERAPVAA
ncbi:MFS transporter [Actinomadura craniellae]|uniref:MFS transporter n=1 Tax=Actinomadura craniellae TaxID=2231787 RepID=A0A365GZT7_9ACTN|nr:MFS transporter [Actinomadura craniellae]RAY12354.1 MFS transporter [Actinomadura craniellae]